MKRKLKLLFATCALCILGGGNSVWAQSWTPVTSLTDGGKYYFHNVGSDKYWGAGNDWGTQASLVKNPEYLTVHLADGKYKIESQVTNGGTKYYFNGSYMDNDSPVSLTISHNGTYYSIANGATYYGYDGSTTVLGTAANADSENFQWEILSESDMASRLAAATPASPVDATYLILDPNFGRNHRNASAWTRSSTNAENKENLNISGGNNINNCAESYHAYFSMSQTLSSVPTGTYKLTAQGFYRQDGSDNTNLPVFYIEDQTSTFPVKTGSENSMSDASVSFTAGSYACEPMWVRVEDGSIELGARLAVNQSLWCIWDNFELTYFGDVTIAAAKNAAAVASYNAAKTRVDAFTEVSMFASDWTTLQTAITANTLDLNDGDLTEGEITTAATNLNNAADAADVAVFNKTSYDGIVTAIGGSDGEVDLTSQLGNPSFESTAAFAAVENGWTNEGVGLQGQNNSGFDGYRVGTIFAERWVGSGNIGAFDTYQTVCVPAGIYQVSAVATFNGNGASLYANSTSVAIGDAKTYSVIVEVADKTVIKLGLRAVSPTGTWFKADNVTLKKIVEFPAYTLATGTMSSTAASDQSSAETTYLGAKTLANYNALLAAIDAAEASKVVYANLKTNIDKANALTEATNFVTTSAASTFASAIATAQAIYDTPTSDAAANSEVTVLGTAVSGWHANADGAAGKYLADAWGKTSGNWWDNFYINTWSTEGDNDGSGFSVPFFEYWTADANNLAAKTMTATLTGLDNGCYEVEVWARVQRRSSDNFDADNKIVMNVNGGAEVSLMTGTPIAGYEETKTMKLGRFTATGNVTDGTLTVNIVVREGSNVHWLSWRDIKYTKVGNPATMSITAAKYGTFVAPFDVAIPSGVSAYTVSAAEGDVLTMATVETTIPANKPVVVFKDEALSQTFYGKTVAGTPAFGLLTGTYIDIDAPNGSYVLQNNDEKVGFYRVNTATATPKVRANRAYLTWPAEAAPRAFFFGEGEATAIEALDALTSGNIEAIYTVGGQKVDQLQKGVNIIVTKDGKSRKVVVK